MNRTVFCIANCADLANYILARLGTAGISDSETSLICSEKSGPVDIAEDGGTIFVRNPGLFVAVGPIVSVMRGVSGAVAGIAGTITEMGIPQFEAKRYEDKVLNGHLLIAVHSVNAAAIDRALEIFNSCGAQCIAATQEPIVPAMG